MVTLKPAEVLQWVPIPVLELELRKYLESDLFSVERVSIVDENSTNDFGIRTLSNGVSNEQRLNTSGKRIGAGFDGKVKDGKGGGSVG